MGTTPRPLVNPTVGLMPTTPLLDEGLMIEPSVSLPSAAIHRLADTATPERKLGPPGLRSGTWGLPVGRPRPLQPLEEPNVRKLAHSLKWALPGRTAPAALNLATTGASAATFVSSSAREPAVVCVRSA